MKLVKVRIKNFKCILDSTDFSIDQLTCLVGKNESGKSAILQALYKLNSVDSNEKYNALYEYPKMYLTDYESGNIEDGDTVVISEWHLDSSEKAEFESTWGASSLENGAITVASGYTNKREWDVPLNFDVLFTTKMEQSGFAQPDFAHFPDKSSIQTVRDEIAAH